MAKVLVVDDDQVIRDLLIKVLSKNGHEVIEASTGEECLCFMRQKEGAAVDFVFLDLLMPVLDGEATLAKLRKINTTVPVAVMTGHGTLQNWFKMTEFGIISYIAKPFNTALVADLVTRAELKKEYLNKENNAA